MTSLTRSSTTGRLVKRLEVVEVRLVRSRLVMLRSVELRVEFAGHGCWVSWLCLSV